MLSTPQRQQPEAAIFSNADAGIVRNTISRAEQSGHEAGCFQKGARHLASAIEDARGRGNEISSLRLPRKIYELEKKLNDKERKIAKAGSSCLIARLCARPMS